MDKYSARTKELGEESDIASQDGLEEREARSESEQDGDEISSDEYEPDGDAELYLVRDKITTIKIISWEFP